MQGIKVWDLLVRILHWSLVICIVGAWLTRDGEDPRHLWFGYAALAIVGARIVWGFLGPRYARFGDFIRSPRATFAYLKEVAARREPRHLGHNPLGGWMIVALLATAAGICITGWLYTTDRFWGVAWVGETHEILTDVLIALVALHILGVVFTSIRQRENLVMAMFTGMKKAPADEPDEQAKGRVSAI
jgi:cytochrome b